MSVYIDGIGVLSRCAMSAGELSRIAAGEAPEIRSLPLDYPCEIPSSKLRRNSRYNKIACTAADQALKDGSDRTGLDSHRMGTVLSTGYGAVEYNCLFADSVVQKDPSRCSPSIFSGSVPNSCEGQISILNQLKGPSTMLAGGDPLEYASLLLRTDRADLILTGSVEEYYAPLFDALRERESLQGSDLSEGAAVLILRREQSEQTYCEVTQFSGTSLGASPFLHIFEDPSDRMAKALSALTAPGAVIHSGNGTWIDAAEEKALEQTFPDAVKIAAKKCFGETLGCGYLLNAALAACAIRQGRYSSVLVTGIDVIGNYCCALLKNCGRAS